MSAAVGARWFREAGAMPPLKLVPVSGRYLSFAEREEIAILNASFTGFLNLRLSSVASSDFVDSLPAWLAGPLFEPLFIPPLLSAHIDRPDGAENPPTGWDRPLRYVFSDGDRRWAR